MTHRNRKAASPRGQTFFEGLRGSLGLGGGAALLCVMLLACDASEPAEPAASVHGPEAAPPHAALPPELAADHPFLSPNAKVETHRMLLEDRLHRRDPGDGGGRMWLDAVRSAQDGALREADTEGRVALPAGSAHRFELVYEAGEHGIAVGGSLFVEADPFWGWSPAQSRSREVPGFVTATPREPGIELRPDEQGGGFEVAGRPLAPGERIDLVYGAGPHGAVVDRYAERGAQILLGVDADGDGFRVWSRDTPRVDIIAREAAMIVAFGPAEVAPGERFELSLAALDALGNRAEWPGAEQDAESGLEIRIEPTSTIGAERSAETSTRTGASHTPHRVTLIAPTTPGTLRLAVHGFGALEGFEAMVPPIRVLSPEASRADGTQDAGMRLYWADLHGHSAFSDGTGLPEDYFAYARDVSRLDAVALTDHDHWGVHPLDDSAENAAQTLAAARQAHEPGRFVTIPGYEWTSWLHGHRHVLYFEDRMPLYSALDPETDRPDELWDALRGQKALTFAHHSAGEPIATNWLFRPDPELEPVTEIVSVHGMSEAADAPLPVEGAIPGYFVRDTLMRGDRLGFIGSGDSHDGHPGLAQLAAAPGQGGLAGIFASRLDRESVLEALQQRRTFATNGIRPWLSVRIDETFMGGELPPPVEGDAGRRDQRLAIHFEATAPIERIDLVRSGAVATIPGDGALSLDLERLIPALRPGEFHYVRIVQQDGGVAWSSPIFASGEPPARPPSP